MEMIWIIALVGGVIGTIVFFVIGKWILSISTETLEKQMRIQNQLLSLIAEKSGVGTDDIKNILTGNAQVKL